MPGLACFAFCGEGKTSILPSLAFLGPQAGTRTRGLSPCLPSPLPPGRGSGAPVRPLGQESLVLLLGGWGSILSAESHLLFPSDPRGLKSKHSLVGCAVWPGLFSKYRNNLDENVVLRWISEDEAINVSHPSLQESPRGLLSQAGLLPAPPSLAKLLHCMGWQTGLGGGSSSQGLLTTAPC